MRKQLKRIAMIGLCGLSLATTSVSAQDLKAGDLLEQSVQTMQSIDSFKMDALGELELFEGGLLKKGDGAIAMQFIESLMNGSVDFRITPDSSQSFHWDGQLMMVDHLLYLNIPLFFGEQLLDVSDIEQDIQSHKALDDASLAFLTHLKESFTRLFDVATIENGYQLSLKSDVNSQRLLEELDALDIDQLIESAKNNDNIASAEENVRQFVAQLKEMVQHYDDWNIRLTINIDNVTHYLTAIHVSADVKDEDRAKNEEGIASAKLSIQFSDIDRVVPVQLPEHATLLTPQTLN